MADALPVIVNASGGTASAMGDKLEDELRAAFDKAGRTIVLELVEGKDVAAIVERNLGARVIAVGGGDGTLGAAATKIAGSGSALGILPLGTRNHLAKQLGIPADLAEAANVCASGRHRRIDVGCAGTRMFVNNASLGIYTRLVRERDVRSGPKWLRTLPAALATMRHWRRQRFELTVDGAPKPVKTPLLFIGNNPYSLDAGRVGTRESLSDGVLSLYAVSARTPWELAKFAARALVGRADADADFEELLDAEQVEVGGSGRIEVGLDGEVVRCGLPLTLRILPGALGVVVPGTRSP